MTVKHLKYTNTTTGETVRAIKVTEKNFEAVAKWINHTAPHISRNWVNEAKALSVLDMKNNDVSGQRVKVRTPQGHRVARVGEFVYRVGSYDPRSKTNNYEFYVGKDEFERDFTKAV